MPVLFSPMTTGIEPMKRLNTWVEPHIRETNMPQKQLNDERILEAQLKLQSQQLEIQKEQTKNFGILIDKVAPLIEKYYSAKLEKIEAPKFRWSAIIFGIMLVVIVVGSMYLVYEGKLGADNFTFLVGVIVGYMMTFIKDLTLGGE